jgi:hypothetical protein
MTDPNQLLWNHAIDNENWVEAERLQRLSEGLGNASVEAAQTSLTNIRLSEEVKPLISEI